MKRWTRTLLTTAIFTSLYNPVLAESVVPDTGFDQFLIELRDKAVEQGISSATMDQTMSQVTFLPRSIELDRKQPEGRLTLEKYLTGTVPDWKIKQARELYVKHKSLLEEIAQAYGVQLTFAEEAFIFGLLMLNSKGAAAVTGGGFVTLAATLAATDLLPIEGLVLLLGVDRFMSEARAVTNIIGNSVAAVVVSRWHEKSLVKSNRLV